MRHKFLTKLLPFFAGIVFAGTVFLFTGKNAKPDQNLEGASNASLSGMQIYVQTMNQMQKGDGGIMAQGEAIIKKEDTPLWAQAGIVFVSGMQVAGVFHESREIINLSTKHQGDRMELFINGVERLDVPDTL